jgi:hypothetical protein
MKEMNNENKYFERIEGGDRMKKREKKKVEVIYSPKQ